MQKGFWQEVEKLESKTRMALKDILANIRFNEAGLVPVIAQEASTGEVLMLAWANLEALQISLEENTACYFSRSRGKLWRKGETSGQVQKLVGISLDCDADAVLYKVEQKGVACHTGRKSCFYIDINSEFAEINSDIQEDPNKLYTNH